MRNHTYSMSLRPVKSPSLTPRLMSALFASPSGSSVMASMRLLRRSRSESACTCEEEGGAVR